MATPSSTWQAAARRKWLALESEGAAATARVRALTDKRFNLSISRGQTADHLKALELAVIRPDSPDGYRAHESRNCESHAELESLDAMLGELEAQIAQATELSAPKVRLAIEAKKILEKLGVISNSEARA